MKKIFIAAVLLLFSISLCAQIEKYTYYENGNKKELFSFNENGEFHGDFFVWSESGSKLAKASYYNGEKNGIWKVWDEKGVLRYKIIYSKGERKKSIKYDNQGNLMAIREF
jgi:antitoxin component YwqK of YwqJK toxin-antitoxin module